MREKLNVGTNIVDRIYFERDEKQKKIAKFTVLLSPNTICPPPLKELCTHPSTTLCVDRPAQTVRWHATRLRLAVLLPCRRQRGRLWYDD
jgi:hypothetical protein